MDSVLRAVTIYLFLMVVFRIAGRRTMASLTNFDFVLLLIIGESTQQALIGDDFSVTTALILIITLIGIDIVFSLIKDAFPSVERWIDGVPIVLIEDGQIHHDRLEKARVDESDILTDARKLQGLERLDQIKYAVLERDGEITIIPRER